MGQGEYTTVIVIRKKTPLEKTAPHTNLISSDLGLAAAQLAAYYRLCFQIEFNFCAAK